ncbi:MAG: Gfo/Idh/MocA family oxidoreductase [Pseudomonadota bacterium]
MKSQIRKLGKIITHVRKKIQEIRQNEINVAFIGCGNHATTNLYPALKYASMNLSSVCALHIAKAEQQAFLFGAESAYDDYHEMLDTEAVDALIVCANAKIHYEAACEALKRGIPVFAEKPPADNVSQCARLVALSKEKNMPIMVGFNKRFAPAYMEAKKIISRASFGALNSINIRAYFGFVKSEISLLTEIGIHYIDLLCYFGSEIRNLKIRKKRIKDKVTIVLTCELSTGALGVIQLSNSYSWAKPGERIELLGEENLVIIKEGREIINHKPTSVGPGVIPCESEKTTVWSPNYSVPGKENHMIYLNGYVGELRHFSQVVGNKTKCLSTIDDGYSALKVIEDIGKE